uniref:Unannotated protein n=1 Tax=freshwater metagenome TaxID=449393 RepID=A0A6J7NN70_9ZZZZ
MGDEAHPCLGSMHQSSRDPAVLKGLGVVAIEHNLADIGSFVEYSQRVRDVVRSREELPVVVEVQPVRGVNGIKQQIQVVRPAIFSSGLADELDERVRRSHPSEVVVARPGINADPAIYQLQIGAALQERVHRQFELLPSTPGNHGQGDTRCRRRPLVLHEGSDDVPRVLGRGCHHVRHREVSVPLDPTALGIGERRVSQQRCAEIETLLIPPGVEGGDRQLVASPVVVHVVVHHHQFRFGESDVGCAGCKQVSEIELVGAPVVTRDLVQRLGATRTVLPTLQVGGQHDLPRTTEAFEAFGCLQFGVKHLLTAPPHCRASVVVRQRESVMACVEMALSQVKHRAGIVRVHCKRLLQQDDVALELVGNPVTTSRSTCFDVVLPREPIVGVLIFETPLVLVQDPLVRPTQRGAEDPRLPTGRPRPEAE